MKIKPGLRRFKLSEEAEIFEVMLHLYIIEYPWEVFFL
jgi:hypothetical protein